MDNAASREVAPRIIVTTYDEDTRMVALYLHHQVVEDSEIIVVEGKHRSVFADSMREMNRIILTQQTGIPRKLYVVTGLLQ
jgi:hypothetical protein